MINQRETTENPWEGTKIQVQHWVKDGKTNRYLQKDDKEEDEEFELSSAAEYDGILNNVILYNNMSREEATEEKRSTYTVKKIVKL